MAEEGISREDDHARDRDDRDRDHSQGPIRYAKNYPDPIDGGPLQISPARQRDEFESNGDFLEYIDAVSRHSNGLPPPSPMPEGADGLPAAGPARPGTPYPGSRTVRSRHVGIRLTPEDYALLLELARAHSVPAGTMARMLVVRSVRAAAMSI